MIYALTASILLSLGTAIFLLAHTSIVRQLQLVHWAILGLGGLYGAGYAFVLITTAQGLNENWASWIDLKDPLLALVPMYAIVLMGALYVGWSILPRVANEPAQMPSATTKLAWILLASALAIQAVYTAAYGGYLGIFEHSRAIRSERTVIDNPFSFLQPFGTLSIFASLIFFSSLFDRPRRRAISLIGLIVSVVFSFYVLLSLAGRQPLLIYTASFFLPVLYRMRVSAPLKIALAAASLPAFILGAFFVANALNLKPGDELIPFLANLISYPHASALAWINATEIDYRYFVDFVVSPIFALPSSIWRNWYTPMDVVNTIMINGAPKGVDGVTGAVPADLLTMSLLQTPVAVLGLAGVGIIVGVALRILQNLINMMPGRMLKAVMSSYIALAIAARSAIVFDPAYFVPQQLMLGISLLAIIAVSTRRSPLPRIRLRMA